MEAWIIKPKVREKTNQLIFPASLEKASALPPGLGSSSQLHAPFLPFAPTPFPINPGSVAFSQELCMGIYISLASTSSSKHAAHKYLCWLWEELRPGLFSLCLKYALLTAAARPVSLTGAGTPCGMNSPKFTCHRYNPYLKDSALKSRETISEKGIDQSDSKNPALI